MFVTKITKTLAVLLIFIFTMSTMASAQFYEVPEELQSYGKTIYSQARSYFSGRSFSGYCGTYVTYQLRAMGICPREDNMCGNGNQWYSNFDNVTKTGGGYYVYRESGRDCLNLIAENYGNDLSNIVLSFPIQSGYSASYPGAGHALVIYRLRDGIAYYSESFRFGQYSEGQVIAEDAQSLISRYSSRHGNPIGCVLLSSEDLTMRTMNSPKKDINPEIARMIEKMSSVAFIIEEFNRIEETREA
jgi:hypothetical protein